MVQKYSIVSGDEVIGSVDVFRCGLYYHICGRCKLASDAPSRLIVTCDKQQVDLGILVPRDGWFCVETRVPVKRIGEGSFIFQVVSGHRATECFVQISPDEPFHYLTHLRKAYLARRGNELGIVFSE